jgi:transaldolase
MGRCDELLERGQSIWIDYIEREFISGGGLAGAIRDGVRGLTSNPAIFQQAISTGTAYDHDIAGLAAEGLQTESIYETLAIADIRAAADAFRPVYEASAGGDGYVSLEVNPALAHAAEETIREAKRLFAAVDRPNLMIKIPATPAGIAAIRQVVAAGIHVNATLLFNRQHYLAVADAWAAGLEMRLAEGQPVRGIASVASFFVSRLDSKLDPRLRANGLTDKEGKTAVAHAAAVYDLYLSLLASPHWQRLMEEGAQAQRLLWASTGTKNRAYSDTLYVDELIGRGTINTVPPATLQAWSSHGRTAAALPATEGAGALLSSLADNGINLAEVTQELQDEGVAAFAKSFATLLQSVAEKEKLYSQTHSR